jgi:WD40 repeat protein
MLITDTKIIVAGVDPVIRSYDMISGDCKLFSGHKGWVYSLFVYKGLLYSGGDDKVVRVWDLESGLCVEELNAHRNGVTSICICNKQLWTGSFDHYVVCYDYEAMKERISEK